MVKRVVASGAAVLALLAAVPMLALAATVSQQAEFPANDGTTLDTFGYAVSISADGSTALVGAPFKSATTGAAYVFTRTGTTWTQQAKLLPTGAGPTNSVGSSVSLSSDGNTALVGAPGSGAVGGTVDVFVRTGTTWAQQQQISDPGAAAGDGFGVAVALSGDGTTAVLGANMPLTGSGTAYVFTRSGTTWTQQQQLPDPGATVGDDYGVAVAISNDGGSTIIGADQVSTAPAGTGTAYVFSRSGTTWTQQQQLVEPSGAAGDAFGSSVSLSGDSATAIVGAPRHSASAGSALVFTRTGTTWTAQPALAPSDPAAGDQFGGAVALSPDGLHAVVGAPLQATFAGAAYLFARSGNIFTQQQKLVAGDAAKFRMFGKAVAANTDGSYVLIGEDIKAGVGAAYVFAVPPPVVPAAGAGGAQLLALAMLTGGTATVAVALPRRRRADAT